MVRNIPSVVKAFSVEGRFNVIVAIPSEMFRVTPLMADSERFIIHVLLSGQLFTKKRTLLSLILSNTRLIPATSSSGCYSIT